MQKHNYISLVLGLATAAGWQASALAVDIELDLPINAVKVYPSSAEVTRSGPTQLPAGEHRLIFRNLSSRLDPARLGLQIGSDQVRMGTLQLEQIHQGDLTGAEEQRLQRELEALQDQRLAVSDEIAGANTQLKLLDSLAAGAGSQQTPIAVADLGGLLSTLASSSAASREVIRNANGRLRELDREIAQKQFELSQVATRQQIRNVVTVNITVDSAVAAPVSLTYPVPQAGWSWINEARLNTQTAALELQRKVSVRQTSGENWDKVNLTITTARPNQNTQTPELGSLLVDFFRPQPQTLALRAPAAADRAQSKEVEEVVVTGSLVRNAPFMTSAVNATQYLVEFMVPGLVTVSADSQPQLLPVDQRSLPVDLIARVVPERDVRAYLEARFEWEDAVPMQAAEMLFYRDGAFIGRGFIDDMLPGEQVSLAFGSDDNVRVAAKPVAEASRDAGGLRRNNIDERRTRYEITSFHAEPINVEVLSRLPVSQNNDIEVEWLNGATPVDAEDVDGNAGVVLWKLTARRGQTASINHFYRITYPRDSRLQFQDN